MLFVIFFLLYIAYHVELFNSMCSYILKRMTTSVHSTEISIAHPPPSQLELNLKSLSSKSSSLIDLLPRKKKKKSFKKPPIQNPPNSISKRKDYLLFLSLFLFFYIQFKKIFNSQPPFAGSEDHVWKNFSLVTLSFSFLSFLFFFFFFGKRGSSR